MKFFLISVFVKIRLILFRFFSRDLKMVSHFYMNGRDNLGDTFNPWLVGHVLGTSFPHINPRQQKGRHLIGAGSLLEYANAQSIIWGSGFMYAHSKPRQQPEKVLALRGPKSLDILRANFPTIQCDVFGDPGLLVGRFYNGCKKESLFTLGIIPHYVDKDIVLEKYGSISGVKIISIETSDVESFLDEVADCQYIASTSLHGIIFSESIGKKSVWLRASDLIAGGDFKFQDYYEGTGRLAKPLELNEASIESLIDAAKVANEINGLTGIQDQLVEVLYHEFSS